ncbi:PXA domain-containing protein [Melampsora americana]|nr:PXA domain-containing protein [Melampsora americana]
MICRRYRCFLVILIHHMTRRTFRPHTFNLGLPHWIQRHDASRTSRHPASKTHYRMRFSTPAAYSAAQIKKTWETRSDWRQERLHPKLQETSTSVLDRLLMKIMRDFVWQWHNDLVPSPYGTRSSSIPTASSHSSADTYSSPSFPLAVEKVIRHCLKVLFIRLERPDLVDLVVHKVLPILTTHIEAFRQAESDLRGGGNPGRHTGNRPSSRRDSRGGIYGAFFSSGNDEIDLLLARLHAEVLRKRNTKTEQNPATNGDSDGPRPIVRLHPAVDVPTPNSQASEQAHLRRLLDKILPILLPPAEAGSRAVKILVIELLTCSILGPIIDMLSDSDFWNRLVEDKAGNVIREQKMVEQLREVLDRQLALASMTPSSNTSGLPNGASDSRSEHETLQEFSNARLDNRPAEGPKDSTLTDQHSFKGVSAKSADRITVTSSVKDFERISRSLHRCNTLFDVRRLKNDIDTEIRRSEALLAGQINLGGSSDSENNQNVSSSVAAGTNSSRTQLRDLVTYLERLQAVRETADHRIAALGGAGGPIPTNRSLDARSNTANAYTHQHQPPSQNSIPSQFGHKPSDILQAILRDRESPALSYFTEFMDRRRRVNLVQFWLAVDGLKDPLEEELILDDTSSPRLQDTGHPHSSSHFSSSATQARCDQESTNRDWEALKDDLKAIAAINFGTVAATTALGLRAEDVSPLLQFLSVDHDSFTSDTACTIDKALPTLANVKEAKNRLFNMQHKVFERMLCEDFPAFSASGDLYLRATASVILRPSRSNPASSNVSISEDISHTSGQKARPALSPGMSMSPIKCRSPPIRQSDSPVYPDLGYDGPTSPQSAGHNAPKVRRPLVRSNSDEPKLRPTNPLTLLAQYQSFRTSDTDLGSSVIGNTSRTPPFPVAQNWKPSDRSRLTGGAVATVLPPQVTLQAAFDERLPSERLTGTTHYSRQSSNQYTGRQSTPIVDPEAKPFLLSPSSSSSSRQNNIAGSSSLDFLMFPSAGDRAPLFGEDLENHHQDISRLRCVSDQPIKISISRQSKHRPQSELRLETQANKREGRSAENNLSQLPHATEPSMNLAASIALQEALSSIISTADNQNPAEEPVIHMSSSPSRISPRLMPSHSDTMACQLPTASQSSSHRADDVSDRVIQRKGLFDDDPEWDSDDSAPREATFDSSHLQSTAESSSMQTLRGLDLGSRTHGRSASRDRTQSSLLITGLSDADERIVKLENQLNLLSSLMRRAELTGNRLEIRLVRKSMDSVSRELSEVIYQKTRLIEQKEIEVGGFRAKLIPGRVRVSITGTACRSVSSSSSAAPPASRGSNLSPIKSGPTHSTMNLATAATGLVTGGTQDVVLYTIEVHKLTEEDGSFGSGWIVTRRYNEFNLLHKALKDRYSIARQLDFPAKSIGIGIGISMGTNNSRVLVEQRKLALERYLRSLIQIPVLCESPELAAFLSRSKANLPFLPGDPSTSLRRQMELFAGSGFVRSIYKSITSSGMSSVDDNDRGRNQVTSPPSMFEVMMSGLRQQAHEFAYGYSAGSSGVTTSSLNSAVSPESISRQSSGTKQSVESSQKSQDEYYEGDTLANLTTNVRPIEGELLTSFTAPICDFLIEIFELNDKNQWLRKQGIVIVLQQILGGTIERKLRDSISEYLDDEHLSQLIGMLEESLWESEKEGGKLKKQPPPRTFEQKIGTRDGAYRKLSAIIPGKRFTYSVHMKVVHSSGCLRIAYQSIVDTDLAASVLGRSNARRGVRRLFSMCQNRRLNKHLIYTIIDEVLRTLFPEAGI